jgi:hypothetical protein
VVLDVSGRDSAGKPWVGAGNCGRRPLTIKFIRLSY